ncbi:hypothetical protein K491DRAFT_672411 [Lophiostoma macrostomum CBS 122681]|uniref:DUF6594 domain-containing protein n=1 Tax=Lophiostoma macrostomum CBS 122681 TaxID=1314788 RepID=A0A6A6SKK5_9PLEO|nr:hypothetical protein K491DRAFT_672411 [Lophiostoma macrostomum CBS 122681]
MLRKLEDHRQGYPRLAAFLALDSNFTLVKRFDNLHLRILLDHQDRLAELEEKLQACDDQEEIQLNLCSRRQDSNETRRTLLTAVEVELERYSRSILRFKSMAVLPEASRNHRRSVLNWFMGNKPLVRSESRIWFSLDDAHGDFVSLGPDDDDSGGMETAFSTIIQAVPLLARLLTCPQTRTSDPNIFVFHRARLRALFKFLVALFIPIALVLPGFLMYRSKEPWARATISALFTFTTSFAICLTMKTTKYSLFLGVIA